MKIAGEFPYFYPLLRFYTWDKPTISIGYNQNTRNMDFDKLESKGVGFVRRITGGRAVMHHKELTYSLVGKSVDKILGNSIHQSYMAVSNAFIKGLNSMGIDCSLEKSVINKNTSVNKVQIPCFASTARYEVIAQGRKLLGSAQKRTAQTFLQHGSLLMEYPANDVADFLLLDQEQRRKHHDLERNNSISLKECGYKGNSIKKMIQSLKNGFHECFGVEFEEYRLNDRKLAQVSAIEKSKYLSDRWNKRI
ncbi:MAG: biotin/lipoate A/B protein ligase family protein [bacterium]